MPSVYQRIAVHKRLLVDHVAGYSRRAEAVLGAAPSHRAERFAERSPRFRKLLVIAPLACLFLVAGRGAYDDREARASREPIMRLSRFATETECWTAIPMPPPNPSRGDKNPAQQEDSPIVSELKGIFREEGIPPALVWIAEVESAFDPAACSRAGAMGLFQLMPETARRYGLRTRPVDDRRDPAVNARAAARYLRHLHARFGDWPLAVAAYNAGEERVARMLRINKAATLVEIAPLLPRETRSYVPRVFNIVSDRERVDPHRLPPPTRS